MHDDKLLVNIESLLPELNRKAHSYSQLGNKGLISIYTNI
jgi:hypothetical protein